MLQSSSRWPPISRRLGTWTQGEDKYNFVSSAVVIIVSLLAHTKNYYLAGLVPLFPDRALPVGCERNHAELKMTILFSLSGMIPFLIVAPHMH